MKILVADRISPLGVEFLQKQDGFEVIEAYGLSPEQVLEPQGCPGFLQGSKFGFQKIPPKAVIDVHMGSQHSWCLFPANVYLN